ncbi:MAG: hypothetical protein ACXVHS_05495, partial [Methanobacterium sp.]
DCPFNKKGYEHVKNKFDKMNAKLKEKQDKKFSTELWDNWAKQNFSLFNSLVDDATIAISMAENNDRIILLQKENDGIKISIKELKNLNELENLADLIFIIGEKEIGEILKDNYSAKFVDLIGSGKIGIYGLISQLKLIEKGYQAFLYQLGFNLGGGCGCG